MGFEPTVGVKPYSGLANRLGIFASIRKSSPTLINSGILFTVIRAQPDKFASVGITIGINWHHHQATPGCGSPGPQRCSSSCLDRGESNSPPGVHRCPPLSVSGAIFSPLPYLLAVMIRHLSSALASELASASLMLFGISGKVSRTVGALFARGGQTAEVVSGPRSLRANGCTSV